MIVEPAGSADPICLLVRVPNQRKEALLKVVRQGVPGKF